MSESLFWAIRHKRAGGARQRYRAGRHQIMRNDHTNHALFRRRPITHDPEGPSSGIRLARHHGPMPQWLHEPEPCVACGSARQTRRLPTMGGVSFCLGCVDLSSLDEFDTFYVDLGGPG